MTSPSSQQTRDASRSAPSTPMKPTADLENGTNVSPELPTQKEEAVSSEMAKSVEEAESKSANNSDTDEPQQTQPVEEAVPSTSHIETSNNLLDETRRSGRARKQTQRLVQEVESSPLKPVSASKPSTQNSGLKRKQPLRGNFSSDFLLQNPQSKLAKINLSDLLTQPQSWTSLTRTQQAHLISLLPSTSPTLSAQTLLDNTPEDEPLPNLLLETLLTNTSFQTDLRLFQEDLSAGRYDPIWLRDAANASTLRAQGKFDDWKETNRETFWGQKQKSDWSARAGDSSIHSLDTLCLHKYLRVGDVLTLLRTTGHGSEYIRVEKEATLTSIDPTTNYPTFKFPPKTAKFSTLSSTAATATNDDTEGHDIMLSEVGNPKQLSDAILREDGRISTRGANSWKEFRCFRENQDMGSLFDLRELFHARNSSSTTSEPKKETKKQEETKKEVTVGKDEE